MVLSEPPAAIPVGEHRATDLGAAFDELDAKIEAGMKAYGIPGVAAAVWVGGREHVKGYGVTNIDHPTPVDGDTVFRIGSTTKTFTGTVLMRLVEQGKVDLDAPVRRYLPDFSVADPAVSAAVTVRQLLNHTSGWMGDDVQDFGRGEDAVARYVASMTQLPQVSAPGSVFAYNNAALVVAGRIIEVVTDMAYETAVQNLLLDPLQLSSSRYFTDQIIGLNVAAAHDVVDGKPVVDTSFWGFPRSCNPTGGLLSTARDQLRYARFHLDDGTADDGSRVLTPESLVAMRSGPGAGGTLLVELTGMGVTWMLRPSAEDVTIVQHGGSWAGQHSGFLMVPERDFAMTVLTNSQGGTHLHSDLFADDWALRLFLGISNTPAVPQQLDERDLQAYAGRYAVEDIAVSGVRGRTIIDFRAGDGQLDGTVVTVDTDGRPDEKSRTRIGLVFYRHDYGIDLGPDAKPLNTRSDFVRGPDGAIAWFRSHGRLFRRL
ncbi:beta-lactamase family protein [Mycobacterium barrassiae]|uniref:serine hydrolase domain-containing protein n=1 Tax=Mycobacterium barrassiae TaxID=319709 RepID=UPI002265ED89|nr:serine hydrolase domain-containing protein [Mycobacterium barrassiae]MCV7302289.1 beta-lactamase family protein [Mycobacterium barrassiae]